MALTCNFDGEAEEKRVLPQEAIKTLGSFTIDQILDDIRTQEDLLEYATLAMEEEEFSTFLFILGELIKKRGMSSVAKLLGKSRESLYRSFSGETNVSFSTALKAVALFDVCPSLS